MCRSRCKGFIRAFSALSSAVMLKLFPYAETILGKSRAPSLSRLFYSSRNNVISMLIWISLCRSTWHVLASCRDTFCNHSIHLSLCTWSKRCGSEQYWRILQTSGDKVLCGVPAQWVRDPWFLRIRSQNSDDSEQLWNSGNITERWIQTALRWGVSGQEKWGAM